MKAAVERAIGPRTLDESLLAGEIMSGQTSASRRDIFERAAQASGFSIMIVPEGGELRHAVDPKYENERTRIELIRTRIPYIITDTVNPGNFGYYVGKPSSETSHGAFWDAELAESSKP